MDCTVEKENTECSAGECVCKANFKEDDDGVCVEGGQAFNAGTFNYF